MFTFHPTIHGGKILLIHRVGRGAPRLKRCTIEWVEILIQDCEIHVTDTFTFTKTLQGTDRN